MAKIQFRGLVEYEAKIEALGKQGRQIAGKAIYEGSRIIADAIRKSADSLPEKTGVTKQGIKDGLGISKIEDDNGYYNVKIGFNGYNANGRPNVLMARLFESGTSKVQKHPFVRPAVTNHKKEAEESMGKTMDEEIKKIMK